jgi:hypothetical protein
MSKMGLHDPFRHMKHKLWPKEGPGVKLEFWRLITKSWESPRFSRVQMECDVPLESFWRGLQLCFRPSDLISIRCLHAKLWVPKVARVPLENLGTKCHLDVGLMERHKVYYMGEGGGFPQVRAMVNLVSPSLSMANLSIKSAPTMH